MNDALSQLPSKEFPLHVSQEQKEGEPRQTDTSHNQPEREAELQPTEGAGEGDEDDGGYLARKRRRKERKHKHKKHHGGDGSGDEASKLVPITGIVPSVESSSVVVAVFRWFVEAAGESLTSNIPRYRHRRYHVHHHR